MLAKSFNEHGTLQASLCLLTEALECLEFPGMVMFSLSLSNWIAESFIPQASSAQEYGEDHAGRVTSAACVSRAPLHV